MRGRVAVAGCLCFQNPSTSLYSRPCLLGVRPTCGLRPSLIAVVLALHAMQAWQLSAALSEAANANEFRALEGAAASEVSTWSG